jgi:tetratricopeptide (TPR) repeat protein
VAAGSFKLTSLATAAVLYYRPALQQLLRPQRQAPASPVVKPHALPAAAPVVNAEVEPEEIPAPRPMHHRPQPAAFPPLPKPPPPPATPRPAPVGAANAEPGTPDIPLSPPAPVAGGPQPESPRAALSREMPAFRAALRALNVDRDGQAALAALDAYQRDFPTGTFRKEAFAARVDALILLGRRDEALSELESAGTGTLRQMPRGAELCLLRGELLKERGDCVAAMATFDQALDEGPAALAERALWGRAGCRAAVGRAEESRADLEQYLRLFPHGIFAKKVRAALAVP